MPAKYFCLFCKKEMKDNGYDFSLYFTKHLPNHIYEQSYTVGDVLPEHYKNNIYEIKEICDSCRTVICESIRQSIKLLVDDEHKDLREIYKLECTK